ncbi:hypothetical protein KI387_015858 [Taxus chinensis]|uniref:Protein kinase domain-containing protein n=1 Tax=Taxus chinensis TaxID=29808 RepID=A0AA38GD86_TAXCH|nr:hypothetical protein KI387_015858 [Taxus chinensis]
MYAKAGKEAVDMLFNFLVFPAGAIAELSLHGSDTKTKPCCISNLYSNIEALSDLLMKAEKSGLLDPKTFSATYTNDILSIHSPTGPIVAKPTEPPKYYVCTNNGSSGYKHNLNTHNGFCGLCTSGGIQNKAPLTWEQQKNIVVDTAKGLCYLYFDVRPTIYHGDIKATNNLLDDQKNTCVVDFKLVRINMEGKSHLKTRIVGTHDYLAPEYALYSQLIDQSDVYNFGIVLVEIMSSRKALDTSIELPHIISSKIGCGGL